MDEHQEAFGLLKAYLTSVLVIGYPGFSHPFDLKTDASSQGLGAILSQRNEHTKNHVIAYIIRSLHSNEQSV